MTATKKRKPLKPGVTYRLNKTGDGFEAAPEPSTNGHAPPPASAPTWRMVPLDNLYPCPLNPRKTFDDAALEELAASIRTHGVLEPLMVRHHPVTGGEDWEIIAGERRYRAAKLAGLAAVPCTCHVMDDRQALHCMVIENEQRADVLPLEKAAGYQQLIDQGEAIDSIAADVGKSAATIRGVLALLRLPEAARTALTAGTISASVAGQIAKVQSDLLRQRVAYCVLNGIDYVPSQHFRNPGYDLENDSYGSDRDEPLSYRQTKSLIEQHCHLELKRAPFGLKVVDLVPEAGSCQDCPKRAGNDPALRADGVRADVCTDPSCYRLKAEAQAARTLRDESGKGARPLEPAEEAALFKYGNQIHEVSGYYDLAEQCWSDHAGKNPRSYKQLLEKHIQPSDVRLATDPDGNVHRLVHRDTALPILRKEYGLCKGSHSTMSSPADEKERQKKQREETAAKNAARKALLGAIAGAAENAALDVTSDVPALTACLRFAGRKLLSNAWGETRDLVLSRRGMKGSRTESGQAILDWIDGAAPYALVGLLVEVLAGQSLLGYTQDEHGKTLLAALGIDRKAVESAAAKDAKKAKVKS